MDNGHKRYVVMDVINCVLLVAILVGASVRMPASNNEQAVGMLFFYGCIIASLGYMARDIYRELNGYPQQAET